MRKLFFYLFVIMAVVSCKNIKKTPPDDETEAINIFSDEIIQQIYTLQNERNTLKLMRFFKNEYALYRQHAALAFASVQDSLALSKLIALLDDESEKVRRAAAYAIGQIKSSKAQNALIAAVDNEGSFNVQATILEAIGKCGTRKGLRFVTEINYPKENFILLNGQLWALNRFAIRNISSNEATKKAVEYITNAYPEEIRYLASVYFARTNDSIDVYENNIISTINTENNRFAKANLLLALKKIKTNKALLTIANIAQNNSDYRLSVNAIEAFSGFDYAKANRYVFGLLNHTNINVAIKAAEYFVRYGQNVDASLYFQRAKEAQNHRVQSLLLEAALKNTDDKIEILTYINEAYKTAENKYQKADLLYAMGSNAAKHAFIADEIWNATHKIIATRGMEALIKIRNDSAFHSMAAKNKNIESDFAAYFKKAIESRDVALVAMAANVLRNPEFKYNEYYENVYFLKQALENCEYPKEIETYIELQKTVNYFFGTDTQLPQIENKPIDWEFVNTIPATQKVVMQTLKGNIIIQLKVNQAPSAVSNFLQLIGSNFYDNKAIHRVVPNFVIQDGCPRGDGWGSTDYTICSEFAPLYYGEGTLGMASAGKDTESTQWFITHSPTPHLDGRYTIFGEVISGMETLHKIEVSDEILGFDLL